MGVVFVVLALLLIVIQSLGLLDRVIARRQSAAAAPTPAAAEPAEAAGASPGVAGHIVAVITAALALAEAEARPASGVARADAGGTIAVDSWAQAGRRRQMDARGRPAR
jgi:Na+-transporting methylmalonyl-CoA/oxaloacetate decarboxylase gamma subunit